MKVLRDGKIDNGKKLILPYGKMTIRNKEARLKSKW